MYKSLILGQRARAYLDVCTGEVIFSEDKLVKVDVIRERHLVGVDAEDAPLGLLVRQRELDLAVNAPGTDEGRVQRLDAVSRHDHLQEVVVLFVIVIDVRA